MKRKVFAVLFIAAGLSWGTVVPCTGIPSVTLLTGATTCTDAGLTYLNESVGWGGFTSVSIGIDPADDPTNGALIYDITTDPSVVPSVGTGDWLAFWFEVTSPNPLTTAYLYNVDGAGVFDVMTVCASNFADNYGTCPTADVLATLGDHGGYGSSVQLASPANTIWVEDFLQFDDASVSRIEKGFTDDSAAPEPGSLALFGSALIGLAVVGKKRSNRSR